jgi:DNA (cytosine-5)-methyltransferase 1
VGDARATVPAEHVVTRDNLPSWNPHDWRVADLLLPDAEIDNVATHRLNAATMVWLEAWDYFVKECPAEALPGFPIWAYALRDEVMLRDNPPDWEVDFTKKNIEFYRTHREFVDAWLRMKWGPDQQTVLEFPFSRQKLEWQARRQHPTREGRTLEDLVIQLRPSGIRVKPPSYLPALVAITQTSIVGPKVKEGIETYRELTPQEAAKLQGMPVEPFRKAGVPLRAAYKQLGNAVNVGVVRYVGEALRRKEPEAVEEPFAGLPLFGASR